MLVVLSGLDARHGPRGRGRHGPASRRIRRRGHPRQGELASQRWRDRSRTRPRRPRQLKLDVEHQRRSRRIRQRARLADPVRSRHRAGRRARTGRRSRFWARRSRRRFSRRGPVGASILHQKCAVPGCRRAYAKGPVRNGARPRTTVVLIPITTARLRVSGKSQIQNDHRVGRIYVKVDSGYDMAVVPGEDHRRNLLRQRRKTGGWYGRQAFPCEISQKR